MNDESIAAKKEVARARKAEIALWTSEFEKKHGRLPTKTEKRSEVGTLLAEYEEAKQAYESLKALRAKSKSELSVDAATGSERAASVSPTTITSPGLNGRTNNSVQSPARLAPLSFKVASGSVGHITSAAVQEGESAAAAETDTDANADAAAALTSTTLAIEANAAQSLSACSSQSILSPMQPLATAEDVAATSIEPSSGDSIVVGAELTGLQAKESVPLASLDISAAPAASSIPQKVHLEPISSPAEPQISMPAISSEGPPTALFEGVDSTVSLRHKKFRAALKGQGPGVLATAFAVQLRHEVERIEPELTKLFGNIVRGWGAEFVDEAQNMKSVSAIAKSIAQKRREAWAAASSSVVTFDTPVSSFEEPLQSASSSVEACAWAVNDCLRYRVELPTGQYAAAVAAAREELTHAGVRLDPSASRNFWREREVAKCKDSDHGNGTVHSSGTFGLPRIDGHKSNGRGSSMGRLGRLSGARMGGGVRDVLLVACATSPTGYLRVEVQYHTAASWAWLAASEAQIVALKDVVSPSAVSLYECTVAAADAEANLEELRVLWRKQVTSGQHVPLPPGALGLDYAARNRKVRSVRHRCNPLALSLAAQKVYSSALRAREVATAWVQEACLAAGLGTSQVVHGDDEAGHVENKEESCEATAAVAAAATVAARADPASSGTEVTATTKAAPMVKVQSVLLSLAVVQQRLLDASSRLQQASCSENHNGDFSLDALLAAAANEVDDMLTISVVLPRMEHANETTRDVDKSERWIGQNAQVGDAAATLALRAVLLLPPRTGFLKDTIAGSSSSFKDDAKAIDSGKLNAKPIVHVRIPSHEKGGLRGNHGLMRLSFTLQQSEAGDTETTGDDSAEPSKESVDSAWRALQRYVREEGRRQTRALFSGSSASPSRHDIRTKGQSDSDKAVTPRSFAKSLLGAGAIEALTVNSAFFPTAAASGVEAVPPSTAQMALARALMKKVADTSDDGLSVEALLDALSNDSAGSESHTLSSPQAIASSEDISENVPTGPAPYHPFFMVCVHTQLSYTKQKLVNRGKEEVLNTHTEGQRERAIEKLHSWERNGLPTPPAENTSSSVNDEISVLETSAGAEAGSTRDEEHQSKGEKRASVDTSDGEVEYARGVACLPTSSEVTSSSSSSFNHARQRARTDLLSVRWFRAAAAQGHLGAAVQLGYLCRTSSSLSNTPSHMADQDAMWCFLLAAEHGHAEACFHMGLCYAQGRGVEQRESDAELWFRRAAAAGIAHSPLFPSLGQAGLPSQALLSPPFSASCSLVHAATVSQVELNAAIAAAAAIEGAARCRRLAEPVNDGHRDHNHHHASLSGDPCARHELGLRYLQGRGVVQRDSEAVKWLRLAARHLETPTTTTNMATARDMTMTAGTDNMGTTQMSSTRRDTHDTTYLAGTTPHPASSTSQAVFDTPSANDVLAAASGTAASGNSTNTTAAKAPALSAAAGARERQRLGVDLPGDSLLLAADALEQRRADVARLKEKLNQVQKKQSSPTSSTSQTNKSPSQGAAPSSVPTLPALAATTLTTTSGALSKEVEPLGFDDHNSLKSFESRQLHRDPRVLAAAAAAASLGHLCLEGRGESLPLADQNHVRWFRLAAEHGHAEACFHLGLCYAQGRGMEGDHANGGEANIWFEHAAALAHTQLEGDDSRSQRSIDTQPYHRDEGNPIGESKSGTARDNGLQANTSTPRVIHR